MKNVLFVCLLAFFTGCGVSEQKHHRVQFQLVEATQELEPLLSQFKNVSADFTNCESQLSSAQKQVALLKRQKAELESESVRLDKSIAELERQEAYVFQNAGIALDSNDIPAALKAYKDFVVRFPNSHRVATATEIITRLQNK